MSEATLRALTPADDPALLTATLGNLNWVGERFTMRDVEATPAFAHYAHLDPDRGDFGVAAETGARIVGVAWALVLPADAPGYGFVASEVPEVSLWVNGQHRGQGPGRRLLRALQTEVRSRATPSLSLSVEDGNRARRLYEQEGFVDVPERRAEGVMVWTA